MDKYDDIWKEFCEDNGYLPYCPEGIIIDGIKLEFANWFIEKKDVYTLEAEE